MIKLIINVWPHKTTSCPLAGRQEHINAVKIALIHNIRSFTLNTNWAKKKLTHFMQCAPQEARPPSWKRVSFYWQRHGGL